LSAFIRLLRHPVLADEDKERQKDCFQRNDHCQQIKREMIKWSDPGQRLKIDEKPESEPNYV